MSATRTLFRHLSFGALAAVFLAVPVAGQTPTPDAVAFTVFMGGNRVGTQVVALTKNETGWLLASVGALGAPFNLVTRKLEIAYGPDWQAQRLVIQGTLNGQPLSLTTTFGAATATSELIQAGEKAVNTQPISPRSVVLPDNFFGTYEALAARLANAQTGTTLPIYRAPEGEVAATVDRVTPRRLVTAEGPVAIREFVLTFATPRGSFPVEVWTDDRQRLARIVLPVSSVVVIRDDLASVTTREDHTQNPGDEAVFIPANGFSIGATITKGAATPGRLPAVILAAGPGNPGRERLTGGVPVFGRLAGTLADSGFLVVRYDARGSGQTGGRTESAGLVAYRDDLFSIVQWLRKRRDVDPDRLVVVGYGDSAPIALLSAERERRIRAVVLLAASGRSGRDAVLTQQERMLTRLNTPEAERGQRIALQTRVIEAVVTGKGWESISTDVRRDADTPLFRSWLLFDPAVTLEKVEQPVLVIHGALDPEIPPAEADRLEELARNRKQRSAPLTRKVIVGGVNHAFVPGAASSASADDTPPAMSADVGRAIVEWYRTVVPAR